MINVKIIIVYACDVTGCCSAGRYLEVAQLKRRVRDSGRVKIIDGYDTARAGVELVYEKLRHIVNIVSLRNEGDRV